MVRLEEIVMIHDLRRQGLSVSAIARKTGLDRKTVRKHLAGGIAPPAYKPRPERPRLLEPFEPYLLERITQFPDLSGKRLLREITAMGFTGGYTSVTDFLRSCRPERIKPFERRFETPAGRQAQVDFAQFRVEFTDDPGITRIVWLFSMVLGHSRWLWGRFCPTQDLQTVMRCHIDAFAAMGGAPSEVLYDRMKTAVINEDADGVVIYNRSLVALLDHYGALPRACRPYRAKTKGKIERPFRYIRQDFFLGRSFRNADDLNAQFREWLDTVANVRLHATTRRIVSEHFGEEQPALTALPAAAYNAVLTVERRVSHEGMVSVGGNLYSVPDVTRKRVVEVQNHPREIRIFEDRKLIAVHPVLDGRNQRRVDPAHRRLAPARTTTPAQPSGRDIGRRSLGFYEAVGRRLAAGEVRP
ncbi:IS21 family transposase [Sphingomonas sp. HH69]